MEQPQEGSLTPEPKNCRVGRGGRRWPLHHGHRATCWAGMCCGTGSFSTGPSRGPRDCPPPSQCSRSACLVFTSHRTPESPTSGPGLQATPGLQPPSGARWWGSLLKMGWRGRLLADALHGNPRVLWGAGAGWELLRNRRMASRAGGLGPQCAPPDCLRSHLGGQTPSEPLQGAPPDPLTESHVRPGHLVGAPQLTPCCLVVQPRSGPGPHHTEGPCCGPQSRAAGPRMRQALWRGVCEEHPELP